MNNKAMLQRNQFYFIYFAVNVEIAGRTLNKKTPKKCYGHDVHWKYIFSMD